MSPETRRALGVVARHPRAPLRFVALKLGMDEGELELRLLAAANAGLVTEFPVTCCQQRSRFEITEAGLLVA